MSNHHKHFYWFSLACGTCRATVIFTNGILHILMEKRTLEVLWVFQPCRVFLEALAFTNHFHVLKKVAVCFVSLSTQMDVLEKLSPPQLASLTLSSDAINEEEEMCQILAKLHNKPSEEIYQFLDEFNREAAQVGALTLRVQHKPTAVWTSATQNLKDTLKGGFWTFVSNYEQPQQSISRTTSPHCCLAQSIQPPVPKT